jgi:uncharacterized protein YqeY
METKQKLEEALHAAMRSNDELQKRTLRMALSSIKFEEKTRGKPMVEADVIAVLQKEIKMRRESIEGAEHGNRADLVETNQKEISVLETFLPKQLTEEELRSLVQEAVVEANATSPSDMGKIMKILVPKIQGRAPNNLISQIVRQVLGG